MAKNSGPGKLWLIFENPKFGVGMKEDGDVFFGCWSDLVRASVKFESVIIVNPARSA